MVLLGDRGIGIIARRFYDLVLRIQNDYVLQILS